MRLLQYVDRPGILDLGWGHPPPALLPVRAWSEASAAALSQYGWQLLTYGHNPGPAPLVDWLGSHLSTVDARGATPAETFVTAGASHALELVSTLLTRPGDLVVVQSPTYHLALRILGDHRVSLVPAPADADGIDPDATAALVARAKDEGRRVPLLYLVPTFANPTGATLPDDRRRALVELARRERLTIVEDDTYRELAYDGPPPASMWSRAEGGEVIRLGSFAKTVAPGLRLGWVNAAPGLVDRLADIGYVESGGGVNHATALTMAVFGASGAYDAQLRTAVALFAGQRDVLVAALRAAAPTLTVPSPAGGWFLWVGLPEGLSARALLPAAETAGVSYVDGSKFCVDGAGDDHLRLSFSMLPPDDLVEAARRLGQAVGSPLTGEFSEYSRKTHR
jgi:2-aminoadipate transaminase